MGHDQRTVVWYVGSSDSWVVVILRNVVSEFVKAFITYTDATMQHTRCLDHEFDALSVVDVFASGVSDGRC